MRRGAIVELIKTHGSLCFVIRPSPRHSLLFARQTRHHASHPLFDPHHDQTADYGRANHISGSLDRGRVEPSAKQRRFKAPPMCGLTLHKLLDDDLTSRQAKSHETDYFSLTPISLRRIPTSTPANFDPASTAALLGLHGPRPGDLPPSHPLSPTSAYLALHSSPTSSLRYFQHWL